MRAAAVGEMRRSEWSRILRGHNVIFISTLPSFDMLYYPLLCQLFAMPKAYTTDRQSKIK